MSQLIHFTFTVFALFFVRIDLSKTSTGHIQVTHKYVKRVLVCNYLHCTSEYYWFLYVSQFKLDDDQTCAALSSLTVMSPRVCRYQPAPVPQLDRSGSRWRNQRA